MRRKKKEITSLYDAFFYKYPKYMKVLQMFETANDLPIEWSNITKASLSAFVGYLLENVAQSSAKTYCAMLKSVINTYSDQVELPKGWEKILSVKNDISQHVYLTEEELQRVIDYAPESETEAIVQQQFVLAALTGARHSDAEAITEKNIINGRIVYVSKKTHIKAEVPLSPVVADILDLPVENRTAKFSCSPFAGAHRKKVSDPTFNNTIRRICERVGINTPVKLYFHGDFVEGQKYEFVAGHTARRSAATLLYLRCHDIYLVSKIMGHASTSQTEKYICVGLEGANEQVIEYFRQFK